LTDYDNTNSGVAFPPFEDMNMILQGKVNVEGRDAKCVVVRRVTQSGMEIMEVYEKVGVMFKNDNTKENAPDYTGKIYDTADKQLPWTAPYTDKRLAAWRRIKESNDPAKQGKPYMTFVVSEPQNKNDAHPNNDLKEDEIPF
jgi:hypothetical protein|tara:strand:+ start:287 stop:712 length:426 start_codon:yes stop_codon:yes gene_type:complete